MTYGAVDDWLALLIEEGDQRSVPVTTDPSVNQFDFLIDETILGKVRTSIAQSREYTDDRNRPYIWLQFDAERDQIEATDEYDVYTVVLDIEGRESFDPGRDNFLVIPESLLRHETYTHGQEQIPILGTGEYGGELGQYPNEWSVLFSTSEPQTVTEYASIQEATTDIRKRLDDAGKQGWLTRRPTSTLIEEWTDALAALSPGGTISCTDAVRCQQVLNLYEDLEPALEDLGTELETETLPQLTRAQTVFVVLVRDLQDRANVPVTLDAETFRTLYDGDFQVTHISSFDDLTEGTAEPMSPPEEPARGGELARQLQSQKQIVLYGPPGTGKTYQAMQFARWWVGSQDGVEPRQDQVRTVTFHPSVTYEDFIEGLTAESTQDGSVSYRIDDGVFKTIARDARDAYYRATAHDSPVPRYVLIIDEINRADISNVFGELITGLESDKRLDAANETQLELAHSGDSFTIPPNLYLVGTMNTADRSISLVDAALRRRFRFLSVPPDYGVLFDTYGFGSHEEAMQVAESGDDPFRVLQAISILALKSINTTIIDSPDLDKGKQIGHAYLLDIESMVDLVDSWRFEILPLLEEYYYGQFSKIRSEIFHGGGDALFDWDREQITAFNADELAAGLARLINLDDDRIDEVATTISESS